MAVMRLCYIWTRSRARRLTGVEVGYGGGLNELAEQIFPVIGGHLPLAAGRMLSTSLALLNFFPRAFHSRITSINPSPYPLYESLHEFSVPREYSKSICRKKHHKNGSGHAERGLFEALDNEIHATSCCIGFIVATNR